jgi:putative membrane protein insertion efficiency factor
MDTTDASEAGPAINVRHECCSLRESDSDQDSQAPPKSGTLINRMTRVPGLTAIGAVRLYQYLISPMLGQRCRFYPSCSNYFILSVRKYGLLRSLWKGTARICRCHPWNPGGYDPP